MTGDAAVPGRRLTQPARGNLGVALHLAWSTPLAVEIPFCNRRSELREQSIKAWPSSKDVIADLEHDGCVASAAKDRVDVAESSAQGRGDDTSVQYHLPVGRSR